MKLSIVYRNRWAVAYMTGHQTEFGSEIELADDKLFPSYDKAFAFMETLDRIFYTELLVVKLESLNEVTVK